VRIEDFHDLGEIGQRAGQAVYFVDHHYVDPLFLDVDE
jgi:hypothetical protein